MRRLLAGLAATALATAALVLPGTSASATTAAGTFNVLTYNVAGLPQALSSAPTPRDTSTTAIGQRLGPYDIVHVQEDFNYHAYLYAGDTTHPYRTPTSGGAAIGSGLNSLSKSPFDGDDFERTKWNSCQYDSGDCLTPKGFTFMRTRLADGVYVDFYNVHTNAGTSSGDLASRADNLSQLTSFIQTHSGGNAVVVMGDTNTRYTRAGDTIASFAANNGLTDAWVQLERGGTAPAAGSPDLVCNSAALTDTCEVVDKVLYRGSTYLSLNATTYHNEHAAFLDSSGAMLSDHDPVTVKFSWSTNPAFQFSEQFGGPHGDYYNDINSVGDGAQPTAISMRSGSRVDQVGITLPGGTTLTHGGTGGTYASLSLAGNEYVNSAYLCQAQYNGHTRIFYARFTTNLGRNLAGGSTTSDCTTLTAPAGWQISGFWGRSGDAVDKLGLVYTPKAVMLVNRATGKCLDVYNWSTADGGQVLEWACTGGANQRWRIEPLPDGTNRLVNLNSGKPLDVYNCGTADGTAIDQWGWWNNACQRWTLTATDSGYVRLVNPNSGKVADLAGCSSADGTAVRLGTWRNTACQQWITRP
ncbi:MAG TPA: RICIN domain-containing protein [Kineosporiaceae bacterium]|nr:RICIN domain-containing protein [Kineosporiaceae bacterium]